MQAWRSGPVPQIQRPEGSPVLLAFDSAAQQRVPVGPAQGTARMYVCGITPYDATHIGHANTYVAFDLLNRFWRDAGLQVEYVQNVTDVDDPLLERAQATGVDWAALAAEQTQLFREDMEALNVLAPSHFVGAVESIPLIVRLVADLQARGVVYAVDDEHAGDLYLDQAQDAAFGSLSHLDEAAARPVFAERGGDPDRTAKRGVLDSLVWLRHRDGDPSWPSPFGDGRPGWHVECAAIALDLLGPDFDVQAGGSDLVFPHHEMSASVGRLATGRALRQGLPAQRHGRAGRGEDEQVARQPRLRLAAAARGRRPDGGPARAARPPLPRRLGVDPGLARRGRGAAPSVARGRPVERGGRRRGGGGRVRAALADDLDAPAALAAVDAWADASARQAGEDPDAARLVALACDALLGVAPLTPWPVWTQPNVWCTASTLLPSGSRTNAPK